jgi:regulatory protein
MTHDDPDFLDDEPRPLPKIQLLSELQGRVRPASEIVPKPTRSTRGAGGAPFGAPTGRPDAALGTPKPKRPSVPEAAPQGRGGGPAGRRKPKAPTEERLWASALYHISQRETSSGDLRRLLLNKVRRFAQTLVAAERAAVESEGASRVEATVARAVREKLIDDARFSEMKVRGWRDRGWGERRIAMEMRRKGLTVELAQDALRTVDGESMDGIEDADVVQKEADRMAAETLCRRKRIGPFRKEQPRDAADRAKVFRREMGALARAGFGADVIRDLLGRPPVDEDGFDGDDVG